MTPVIVQHAPLPEDARRRFDLCVDGLPTVAEVVAAYLPGLTEAEAARVRVSLVSRHGEMAHVPRRMWPHVRPREGTVVAIRVVPGLGGLFSYVATSLALAGASTFVAYAVAGVATLAAVGALAWLAQALIPTQREQPTPEQAYRLDGWQNTVRPGEAVPFPVGEIRMAPTIICGPFREVVNGDIYLRALFLFGHGRLDISDLRIGDNPLDEMDNAEIELREGRSSDTPVTLVPEQVIEDTVDADLYHYPDGEQLIYTHTLPRQCDRARIIFSMPRGIYDVERDGGLDRYGRTVLIEQRAVGASTWTEVFNQQITGKTVDPLFRQFEWDLGGTGDYEIRARKVSRDDGKQDKGKDITLLAVQGIREKYPVAYDETDLTLAAARIRSGESAQGRLDALNAVVTRYVSTWDGTSWVPDQLSRNPAAIYRSVLTSDAGAFPVTEARLHDDEIADWHDFCEAKGLTYDRVLAGDESMSEVLAGICGAGRATWRRDGEGWGVVVDRPQDVIVDRISPRNASDFRWTRQYFTPPDAFSVSFRDRTSGYEQAERVVPWPGHTGDIDVTEELPMPGATDPDSVWIETRRRQYEVTLRADEFSVIQAGAFRTAMRGDTVALSWDMISSEHVAARVRSVSGSLVTLDAPVTMQDGASYAISWQVYDSDDTVGDEAQATLVTVSGEQWAVTLAPGETPPPVDRMVHFGKTATVDFLCRLKRVEPADGMSFTLVMTNDGVEIDTLTDAEDPPAWDRMAGPVNNASGTPSAPLIGTITANAPEYDYTGTTDLDVLVPLTMPADDIVPLARIDVSRRLSGGSWSTTPVYGNSGTAELSYARDADIEVYATAVSVFGTSGAASATETFTVTGASVTLPAALDAADWITFGDLGAAEITVTTRSDTAELQLFRCTAGDTLNVETDQIGAPRPVAAASTFTIVDGDGTRATLLLDGSFDDGADWTKGTGWAIAGGVATHSGAVAGTLEQSVSLTVGQTYRGQVTVSNVTAGSLTVQLAGGTPVPATAITANGTYRFELTAVTGNERIELVATGPFDGDVEDVSLYLETASCAPQGTWDYYVAPVNAARIANVPAGPVTITII